MVFQIRLVFKDFRNFAENYNIENAITSRNLHARCQEGCHSNDNFTQISKMPKTSLEYELWYFKYDQFLRILEILLRNKKLNTHQLREISKRDVKSGVIQNDNFKQILKMPKTWQKSQLNMNKFISNTISFMNFKNSAEKYNIENAITSRHAHARCQEWNHSNDNFKQISKIQKTWLKSNLNMNYGISNTISFKGFQKFC